MSARRGIPPRESHRGYARPARRPAGSSAVVLSLSGVNLQVDGMRGVGEKRNEEEKYISVQIASKIARCLSRSFDKFPIFPEIF